MTTTVQPSDRRLPDSERRRPRREDVRTGILDAALPVFEEHGYAAAGIDEIARRAGYTKGAVYSNFGSKQELFATLLADRLTSFANDMFEDGPEDPVEFVRFAADALAADIVSEQRWYTLVLEYALRAAREPEAAELWRTERRRRRVELTASIVVRASAAGLARADSSSAFALVVMSMTVGLSAEHAADPEGVGREEIAAAINTVITAWFGIGR